VFLQENAIERDILRQGDIISNILILGAININGIQFQVDQKGEKKFWSVSQQPKYSDAMILSHSCEIDPSNSIKLTSLILAPLRDINKATNPSKIEELKKSNYIDSSVQASYLKYFYIHPHPMLSYDDGAIVDFSKCFSLKKESYNMLVERKIIQLNDDAIDKMSLKLALYFYRNNKQIA